MKIRTHSIGLVIHLQLLAYERTSEACVAKFLSIETRDVSIQSVECLVQLGR
jgi:hypothetical protein